MNPDFIIEYIETEQFLILKTEMFPNRHSTLSLRYGTYWRGMGNTFGSHSH